MDYIYIYIYIYIDKNYFLTHEIIFVTIFTLLSIEHFFALVA